MADNNFQKVIFQELEKYFSPIVDASGDDLNSLLMFFKNTIGWDIQIISSGNTVSFVNAIASIASEVSVIETIYNTPPESFSEFLTAVNSLSTLIADVQAIDSTLAGVNVPTFIGDLISDTFEKLTILYLNSNYPIFFNLLVAINIVEIQNNIYTGYNNVIVKGQKTAYKLYFDRIGSFLKNPVSYLKSTFMPSGIPDQNAANVIGKNIFTHLSYLIESLGISEMVGRGNGPNELTTAQEAQLDGMMTICRSFYIEDTGTIEAGATFGLVPESANGPGVFIVPFGDLTFTVTVGNWSINVSLDTTTPGFEINKNGIQFYDTSGKTNLKFNITAEKIQSNGNAYLVGANSGTHLTIGDVKVIGMLDVIDGNCNADICLEIQNSSFTLKAGDGDNFLQKILPADGLNVDFELAIGYNNQKGLYFRGGAGLEMQIPIHQKLLGINFDTLTLSVAVKPDGTIPISASTSFTVEVGSLTLSVENVGVKAVIDFPSGGGNLGPLDLSLGFKSPTGLGISIEADPVSGGGFLNYDESTYTYTGALQLKFSKISLNAIGILTTKMPDGSDGYSLLIIITADFTPIQLGMGFTLNGVGGLLGLNRTMNTDRLRSGVKDGSLDYILFPQNVVANANTIISNLGQAFPVQEGQFLIGPMAKIGWGTPTLLTIELGIILEMPSPVVLAILGVIKAILPSDTNRILAIQVNFLGIIDFSKKYLSFDASLYDSKILTFGLVGDMALRLYWGDNPAFLLSVGGFHPKYTPPPTMNLPAMQRLAIILANDSNLKINVQTYFAVTSNTAQFGASVSAMAHAWKIQAVGAVWFDVLFQFSPFHFMADMGAMFAIKMGSSTILSIYVDLSLEGPNPWRAQGKASFKIVFVRVHVSFDKTFGQANVDNIAPVQVMPQLQSAIGNKDNWQVIGPDRSHEVVTFRQISVGSGQLVVDPFGSLQLSQKIVPLGVTISKFGNSKASDDNSFSIGAVTSGAISFPTGILKDYFAPSSFFFLTDDQKLSRASYELYNSGVLIGNTDAIVADYCVRRQLGYEDIIVDTRQRFRLAAFAALSSAEYAMHTAYNYVSDSKYSTFSGKVPPSGPGKVSMNTATSYVVADKNSLGQVGSMSFGNYTEASLHLDSLRVTDPNAGNYAVMNAFELN